MTVSSLSHLNRIGGREQPSESGHHFTVPSGSALSSWPRSNHADLSQALASLRRGVQPWSELDEGTRLGFLERMREGLRSHPDLDGSLAGRLDLTSAELTEWMARKSWSESLQNGRLVSRLVGTPASAQGTVVLIRLHWGEMLWDLFECVAAELLAGRVVLLLSDGKVPHLAARISDGLLDAQVPTDCWALLHDDGDSVLRAALGDPGVGGFVLSGPRVLGDLDERVARREFGQGVLEACEPVWNQRQLSPRTVSVREDDDPGRAARQIAHELFGRIPSLSGQLPGMPTLVEVAPRILSEFTSELLRVLEELTAGQGSELDRPCTWVDAALATHLEQTLADGIDTGATLIHEQRRPAFSGDPLSGTISRLVFTNVEREMRLLEHTQPAPVLLLKRQDSSSTATPSPGLSSPPG